MRLRAAAACAALLAACGGGNAKLGEKCEVSALLGDPCAEGSFCLRADSCIDTDQPCLGSCAMSCDSDHPCPAGCECTGRSSPENGSVPMCNPPGVNPGGIGFC